MKPVRLKIFVSSVQKEFKQIRLDLKAFLLGDAFLRRFVSEVFLFEELPATDRRADQVYLEQVERCDIYLGMFGYEYGYEDQDGVSPTEREYNYATQLGKTRLIYVWGADDSKRAAKMKSLVRKVGHELIRRRVEDVSALTSEVYASLVDYLDDMGALRVPPFDTSACDGAGVKDLSRKRIGWFLETARRERGFPLKPNTTTQALLTHLNLLDAGKPTNAAVLLFGSNPQRFHRTAETKCIHCHGTEYRRPFASLQVYGGDIFEQADQARDFVLGKINRAIGTRAASITAPATYELPPDAVGEAIVNAIAHRDYYSNASVEVRLFADRLEVWNPGVLPGTLTLDSLRHDHPSVPYNPLVSESLYLTRYIERVGSGTQAMIELCRKAGLPEPQFEQRSGSFVITLWRDWLTDKVVAELDLNNRQMQAVEYVKSHERITNAEYQRITGAPQRTATRDLNELVQKGVLELEGKGRGAQYRLLQKRARNAPNAPSEDT
ncbi:ATP-binding protein [Candidatus Methylomirabilis sp.]|uniref:ATP-binding protein n=1 Tax=Candidatus Methylomirabilis sp. TaxID=2032687 RepID=UPI0030761DC0